MKYYQLTQNNNEANLYIYGDIVDTPFFENDVSGFNITQELDKLESDKINVYISSYGGSVNAGLSIYQALKRHPAKVRTVIDGFACSIASVIAMAGDERVMSKTSLMLIHNAWTTVQGNANDLRREADALEKITQASVRAYMEHINISEEELKELLDNETWLDSQECLQMGFATEILEQEEEAVSQSVRQSLIDMIMSKCKTDDKKKKKCEEEDVVEEEVQEEDIEDEDDKKDEPDDKDDEKDDDIDDDEMDEKCNPKKDDDKKQGTELKAMSSFLNLFK